MPYPARGIYIHFTKKKSDVLSEFNLLMIVDHLLRMISFIGINEFKASRAACRLTFQKGDDCIINMAQMKLKAIPWHKHLKPTK